MFEKTENGAANPPNCDDSPVRLYRQLDGRTSASSSGASAFCCHSLVGPRAVWLLDSDPLLLLCHISSWMVSPEHLHRVRILNFNVSRLSLFTVAYCYYCRFWG